MKQFDLENDKKINTGFQIPENFFEQFETNIMNQVAKNEVKVISIFRKTKFWVSAIAAIFAITIGVLSYLNSVKNETFTTDDYIVYENNINHEDMAEQLTDKDLTEIEKSMNFTDSNSEKELENYIY